MVSSGCLQVYACLGLTGCFLEPLVGGRSQGRDGRYPNSPGIGYQGHLTRKVSGIIDTVSTLAILDTRHSIIDTHN